MKIKHEEFTCEREGLRIRGSLFRPEGKENLPIIVVSHEFMLNRLSTLGYARKFAKMGYAAFCYDFNGGGTISQSQGKTWDMSVMTEKKDLYAVIAFAKKQPFVDPEHLTLMGCSQGEFVSALTAAELGYPAVENLILFYPALSIPDDARKGHMILAHFNPKNVPKILFCGPIILGRQYVTDVLDLDPFSMINRYSGPVLLVHGDADHIVDYKYAVKANETYSAAGTPIKFVTIHHGGHIFPVPHHKRMAWNEAEKFASR